MEDLNIKIETEFIKLDQLLKYSGLVANGSDAKVLIQDGQVKLNGEIQYQRGKKVYPKDKVEIFDISINVK